MAKGNPNPSPATRFGAGNNANPQGRTSAQRKAEIANAELATIIQARMLEALHGVMLEDPTKETIVGEYIKTEILKLLKDAQDRGLGTPKQSIDIESPDGTMSPKPTVIEFVAPQAFDESDD